ncbi:MAG: hypothetical protein ACTSVZ_13875 [Promethearchaeota archaeon]
MLTEYEDKMNHQNSWSEWDLWCYSGFFNGKDYSREPATFLGGLPPGYTMVSIAEINQYFPATPSSSP